MFVRNALSGNVTRTVLSRGLHGGQSLFKAQVFAMPAMSPTMEKGGIVEWKFKVGESFSAGDVLLEVETDKSQIDVEAQDDGKIAKIMVDNGAKDVNVGEPIAYLAEPDDDLVTLELPTKSASGEENPKNSSKSSQKDTSKSSPEKKSSEPIAKSGTSSFGKANASQLLLPSVQMLLHENGVSTEDALSSIKASGPKGRILKGDVLSYLGKISHDSVTKLTNYIQKFEKLDLSNIELKVPEPQKKLAETTPAKPQPVVLSEQIHLKLAPNVTAEQLARSVRSYINEAKYLSHEQPVANMFSDHYDALFEELITPEPTQPRFQVAYDLVPLTTGDVAVQQQEDIFDLLAGPSGRANAVKTDSEIPTSNEFSIILDVKVSDKFDDAKAKAERFVEYVKDLEISVDN
ncbi:LAME_0C01002g1_1 [Lachancea meyersii CBS 8951]|uniref:Dihydrolipoamide dehydrogenase-binding protein of pyruvate dehydrogenase complex n=1 Tax=Lachancea meyersii CBS 8951 TaxID=1266667 RepID=A0A1G4IZ23_9SACH|nr:LAME_0C01002g1_1 [Lachancea meyersii CBS 8951]